MTRLLSGRIYDFAAVSVPLLLIALVAAIAQSPAFLNSHNMMAAAIAIDLTLIAPLVYLFLIRGRAIPNTTVVPMFVLGLVVATLVLPKDQQTSLEWIKIWVLPLVELFVVSYVVIKVYKLMRATKAARQTGQDFFDAVRSAGQELLGRRVGSLLASEIGMMYYGILGGKKAKPAPNAFFYHQQTTTFTMLWALFVLLIVETAVLHIFLVQWNEIVAWIVFAISVYSGIQVLAIVRAPARRPIVVADGKLYLRFSVMIQATINLDNIEQIMTRTDNPFENALKLNPNKLFDDHNVVVRCKQAVTLHGIFGTEKSSDTILLHVDEPKRFQEILAQG